jgi:hypothetical protein
MVHCKVSTKLRVLGKGAKVHSQMCSGLKIVPGRGIRREGMWQGVHWVVLEGGI